jgi:hypothetical protein
VNGNVKVILVGGFSIVFGFYAFMIQGVNNRIIQIGDQKSYYTEARMIATTGLNHAINNMADPYWWNNNQHYGIAQVNNLLIGGDNVSYVIEKNGFPSDQARVTVTANCGGVAAKQIAVIKMVHPPPVPPWWAYNGSPYDKNKKTPYYGDLYCKWQVVNVYVYPYQFPAS